MADLTTTQTSAVPSWAQPYSAGLLQRAQAVTDTPYQQYQGDLVAGMSPYQDAAYQGIANRALQGSSTMSAANGALTGMFGGSPQGATANPYGSVSAQANPYAGANPYLQQNIDQAQGDLAGNWNNVAAPSWGTANQQSGSFGNAGLAMAENNARSDLQRNMGAIGSQMRMADYTTQQQLGESAANRSLQASTTNAGLGEQYASRNDSMFNAGQSQLLSALGMAPTYANQDYTDLNNLAGAGQQYQTLNQNQLNAGYQQYLDARSYPTQQLGTMGTALGQAIGNQGTQTTTQPGASTGSQLVGGAIAGTGLYNLLFGG